MIFKSKHTVALLFLAVLAGLLTLVACTTDEDRIKEANTAAASSGQSGDSGQLTGKISVFDLRDGDCFNAPKIPGGESVNMEDVELVSCSDDWIYRALSSFVVTLDGDYPGQDYFVAQAGSICDPSTGFYLFPMLETWAVGDRVIACIQVR